MATGQLGPGISLHACASRDEGPVTGVDVLEVLEKNGRRRDVRVAGHSSVNDSEVIGADDNIPGERLQGNGDWSAVRVESNSQPLVVGAEILVGSGGVDGCRGRDDGFRVAPASLLMVDGSDPGAVDGKSHWTGLSRIYLDPRPQGVVTSRQIEDLGDLRLCLAELEVEVATVVVLDRDVSSGIPTSGVTGVEARIDEVTSLSPVRGFCNRHLGRRVEDVGSLGLGRGNPDGPVGDGDLGNLDTAGVGKHKQSHRFLCRPGIREFPGC